MDETEKGMSASDNLNPAQLRMFIQAKELMDFPTMEGQAEKPTTLRENDYLRSRKLRESWDGYEHSTFDLAKKGQKTLHQSIKERGVEHPITIKNPALWRENPPLDAINNGHHRIVAANQINPDMYIPIRYE